MWKFLRKKLFCVHQNTNTASMLLKPNLQFVDDAQPTFHLLIVSVYTQYVGPRRVPTILWMCNHFFLLVLIYHHPILVEGGERMKEQGLMELIRSALVSNGCCVVYTYLCDWLLTDNAFIDMNPYIILLLPPPPPVVSSPFPF